MRKSKDVDSLMILDELMIFIMMGKNNMDSLVRVKRDCMIEYLGVVNR